MKTTFRTLIRSAPNIVRDRIFAPLDNQSKLVARSICRNWKAHVDPTLKFRVVLTEDTYRYVQKFGRKRTIEELVVGFFSQPYPEISWKLTVQALSILADYRYEVFYEGPNSGNNNAPNQPALAMVVMPETKLQRLFKEFKNITKLTLSSMAIVDIKRHSFLENMPFPRLKSLDIAAEVDYGIDAVRDLLSNTFKNLRAFSLTISNDDDMTLYSEMYSFLGNHELVTRFKSTFLRAPVVHHSNQNNNDTLETLNLQRDQKLEPVIYANLLDSLGNLKLDHVDIYILSSESRARKNLALHLLQAQKILTTFHLYNLRPENMPIWRTIPSILNKCAGTLKSVILDGCFCQHAEGDPPGPFSGKWVKRCKNLETLEFMVCGISITDLPKFPKSSITTLCLGHSLQTAQIKYILNNFEELENLSLPQAQGPLNQMGNPQISLSNFQSALKLPSLSKLTLSMKTCKYRQIRKFASSLIGVFENGKETLQGETKRGDVEYLIDRTLFIHPDSA